MDMIQRYSSLENRDETVMQTYLESESWPPAIPPRTERRIFTVENVNYDSDSSLHTPNHETNSCVNKDHCDVFRLFLGCVCLSLTFAGLLGFASWTAWGIHNWTTETSELSVKDFWKYTDENTLCVTLSGKDLQHSGCAQYLFHDISESTNYTCCVKDSSRFSFLYQMINLRRSQQKRKKRNTECSRSEASITVAQNDSLLWHVSQDCVTNKRRNASVSLIDILSTDMYSIYFEIPVSFVKTYRTLPNQRIRMTWFRRRYNGTVVSDDILMRKMIQVRKEFQSVDNVFMYGTFSFEKGDQLYIEVQNHKYVTTVDGIITVVKI